MHICCWVSCVSVLRRPLTCLLAIPLLLPKGVGRESRGCDCNNTSLALKKPRKVGWLFWILRPFKTIFQLISGRLPERGRKKREMIDKRKNVQTTTFRTYCSTVGPRPTIILALLLSKLVGCTGTESYPAPSPGPTILNMKCYL